MDDPQSGLSLNVALVPLMLGMAVLRIVILCVVALLMRRRRREEISAIWEI